MLLYIRIIIIQEISLDFMIARIKNFLMERKYFEFTIIAI